ncbi:hypothetical protein [Microbacterium oxydans]|jgi:hypothetical protein|uniref:hypothetical protein n=1 Tax=Microbacterium oxydans TaxID=82380 RepID=UPI000F8F9E19|nr:hypothetical protein [Microbacterium oxydans]AZS48123.1 hypothetical protein CVS53_02835 [Microbacterium oxydans]
MEWILSGAALVVSVAALLHSIYAGPLLVVHKGVAHEWVGDNYVVRGVMLNIFNVGRQTLPITLVGVGTKGGDDVRSTLAAETHPDGGSNPRLPLALEPGHAIRVFLNSDMVVGEEIKVVQLRRDWLLRPKEKYWRRPIEARMIPGTEVTPPRT